jgi:uncharacterized protein YbaA (DUF1428 family)
MNVLNTTEIEKGIGSEVAQFVYRVPTKNHDVMMKLCKQAADMTRKCGAAHLVFQLNNTEVSMEGITNIAKTVSANNYEEVWLELIFYRDRKHRDEAEAKMNNDARMGPLFQQSMDLVTPGTGFIMGEFSRLEV